MSRYTQPRDARYYAGIAGNFICAFIIAFAAYLCTGLVMTADANAKRSSGSDAPLFALEKGAESLNITLFGETAALKYAAVDTVRAKLREISEAGQIFVPSVLTHFGRMTAEALNGIGEIAATVPEMIREVLEE